jgi:hypothetical protein
MSPDKVAAKTLADHDRGRLYVVPQVDARAIWLSKRVAPALHARAGGVLARVGPFADKH